MQKQFYIKDQNKFFTRVRKLEIVNHKLEKNLNFKMELGFVGKDQV